MRETNRRYWIIGSVTVASLLGACSATTPPSSASSLPPDAPMSIEVTDVHGSLRVEGSLRFVEGSDGWEGISLETGGSTMSVAVVLTRTLAADLVGGRLVSLPSAADTGQSQVAHYNVGDARGYREVRSVQMTIEDDSTVTIVAQLGAWENEPVAEGVSRPTIELPSTATMTLRGQLRLTCTPAIVAGESGNRLDPEFASPYCAALRTELGLDALLAISASI